MPGRPVISNCGTLTPKASEFKISQIGYILENAILVAANAVGL